MDDSLLKARLKRKDKNVFDTVFTQYYTGLCAFAYQFVRNRSVAEDLVQDFFVHFWHHCDEINITASVKAYFFSAVRNRSLDYLKHQKIKGAYVDTVTLTAAPVTTQNEYSESELIQQIEGMLDTLQPRCKEIFVMSRLDGFSNKEIAIKLGISKRTVELQISNALKSLRRGLKKS